MPLSSVVFIVGNRKQNDWRGETEELHFVQYILEKGNRFTLHAVYTG
jgi:hypothetical protein